MVLSMDDLAFCNQEIKKKGRTKNIGEYLRMVNHKDKKAKLRNIQIFHLNAQST